MFRTEIRIMIVATREKDRIDNIFSYVKRTRKWSKCADDLQTSPAVVIGTLPETGLILAGHVGMIGKNAPIPFIAMGVADLLFYKFPDGYRPLSPLPVAADAPGVKEADHCFGLGPPMFFADEAAVLLFVPEAPVFVQALRGSGSQP